MNKIFKTFFVAAFGGAVFALVGVPLPWMLGPISIVTMYCCWKPNTMVWPLKIRNTAMLLFGYSMGRPFTSETGAVIISHIGLMMFTTVAVVAAGIAVGFYTHRKTGINLQSCLMGCVPGGLSQMIVLAEEIKDTDVTAVTLMQTIRMLAVIFIIPFLATYVVHDGDFSHMSGGNLPLISWWTAVILTVGGAFLAGKLKMPTPQMLGPLLLVAAYLLLNGSTAPAIPKEILDVGQICMGAYIGTRINLRRINDYHKLKATLTIGLSAVLGVAIILGIFLVETSGITLVTAFLSTAPGGLSEMGITAIAVGADTATMTAYQLTRLLFIMLIVPYILKWIIRCYDNRGVNHYLKTK